MAADEIVLYDLPSRGRCHCWSYNPWKTRLTLNYKGERVRKTIRGESLTWAGLPYQTKFVEYPDIAPTLKDFGLAPSEDDPPYTIPAIKIGNEYFMDSTVIAEELEKRYPTPSLKLDSPRSKRAIELLGPVTGSLKPVGMSQIGTVPTNNYALGLVAKGS
jgi:glutathione S-transferase